MKWPKISEWDQPSTQSNGGDLTSYPTTICTQTLCVADIRATVVTALLDLRVDATLPRMRALLRLTQGMRIVKYRFDGEWEFSAGQVHFTAKEVRECITLE